MFLLRAVLNILVRNTISLTFTDGYVCLCGVYSSVVVLGLFVRLS